ncbi:MAG: 2Fe-2S iron-sulfur cluster binding domain-containing protein [Pseudomonadales bacterium]|nr:2Fe-2S iron-sulfur cluster binding domain-containing protein [Pseudomonadales bacterium]
MSDWQELTIEQVEQEANDTIHVTLGVPEHLSQGFEFKQGQYLTFAQDIAGEEVRRSYSICAGVGEPLSVAIKRIEGGAFSEHAHENFEVGATVQVSPPEGSFYSELDTGQSKNYLLIAAGSGITPILSIAKSVLAIEPNSQVTLLYGNQRSSDIIFREQLLWLKNRYMQRLQWINIFSRERQDAPILNGRINNSKGAELNGRLIDILSYHEFFLCGPEGMISEVSRGLRSMGIDEARIHYELFFASAEDARIAIEKHQERARQYAGLNTAVSVRYGGREIAFDLTADGENILDGAANHGLELPFSCKGGVCATCKARLVEGEVDMDLNHALSAEEVAAGFVLTCQAHPISDRVIVDFDVI